MYTLERITLNAKFSLNIVYLIKDIKVLKKFDEKQS